MIMYKIFYVLYLDSSNQDFEQKTSTISGPSVGQLETLKQKSTASQKHTQHPSKKYKVLFWND